MWKYDKKNKFLKKQLLHHQLNITDDWGVSSDDKFNYQINIDIYKIFSFKYGVFYQIKVPNITVNEKTLWDALKILFKYLYVEGGTCCYERLKDELMSKDFWRKLGS